MELPFTPLESPLIALEPFSEAIRHEVQSALNCDVETWLILPMNAIGEHFETYWANTLDAAHRQFRFPYAIRRKSDGKIVGTSSFYPGNAKNGCIEIGSTFLVPDVRGSTINPEAKRLMLAHAFGCGALRVQFSIDTRNERSQAAIRKLGAVKEGVLRKNQPTWTGYVRDTAIFSILREEWPDIDARLKARLAATAVV